MAGFYEKLCALIGEKQVSTKEPMKNHTTFRVGGPAAFFVTPADERQLSDTLKLCTEEEMPYYVIGNGSNLLVSDEGYDGAIIAMGEPWNYSRAEGEHITAGAGILLSRLSKEALKLGLTGLEFAGGIPGTLGGAVVMNAGAYGSEMKAVLVSARVMTMDGQVLNLSGEELELGYRTSCIPKNRYIVLEATVGLKAGNPEEIRARMEELAERRKSKQPLEYPSAGSTFKRPEGYFAGKLIEDTGLRGFTVGGAQISEKHCGFVINKDHATASDVYGLCREVQRRVEEKFGVDMNMEVKTLGHF